MFALLRWLFKSIAFVAAGVVTIVLLGIPLATWIYVLLNVTRTEATVLEKSEQVYHGYSGNWKLYHRLKVQYQPADTRIRETATIDVDESTWDQSRPGSRVEISYVPAAILRQIPMLYTKALAAPLPQSSQPPDERRKSNAIIRNVTHVARVADSSRSHGVPAWQPFEVVELSFVPDGRNDSVTAVDSVDADSVPNLVIGNQVAVEYSTVHPRAAKIAGGTRTCEWKNNLEVYGPIAVFGCVMVVLTTQRRRKSRS
jgi:hypothetical protein